MYFYSIHNLVVSGHYIIVFKWPLVNDINN